MWSIRGIAAAALLSTAVLSISAGDLDPPGAPASTMVTLDDLNAAMASAETMRDPRTPIDSLPFEITEPGSYVVVADLTLTDLDTTGITLSVDDVTIDLNGFTLRGPGNDAGISGSGISIPGGNNLAVFNGVVRDFRGSGVALLGQGSMVSRVRAFNNGVAGIVVGTRGIVSDCTAHRNGGTGISTLSSAVLTGNTCMDNGGFGISTSNSLVAENSCLSNSSGNINATTSTVVNNHAP